MQNILAFFLRGNAEETRDKNIQKWKNISFSKKLGHYAKFYYESFIYIFLFFFMYKQSLSLEPKKWKFKIQRKTKSA
jgi:hypothetical protein